MSEPTKMEYSIGSTAFGQPLTLIFTKGSAGEKVWVLRQEAADQRDESNVIGGLTDSNIIAMFDAVQNKQQRHRPSAEYRGPG